MPVSIQNFDSVLDRLRSAGRLSLDTETTGLRPFGSSRLFSIIIGTASEEFYFNWNIYEDMAPEILLGWKQKLQLALLLKDPSLFVYMQNAKFDMHMLKNEGLEVAGKIHCTKAIGRIVDNTLFDYGLDTQGKKFLGKTKNDKVKKYILENKLYTITSKGNDKVKNLQYFKVPLDLIVPYGKDDARLTYDLGEYQRKFIEEKDANNASSKKLGNVYQNEMALTKTLFRMEQKGIKISEGYCRQSFNREVDHYKQIMGEFKTLTGLDFVDSRKTLAVAFDAAGMKYGKTDKGNASFTDAVLEKLDNPLAKLIQNYRTSYKMAHSYYKNFLDFADRRGIVHTDFNQGGATTGRMSATQPALQTLPKGEKGAGDDAVLVRRCFVPRSADYVFFICDYNQMEYRFMLEYAGEMGVIADVLGGMDVHEATAKKMAVVRDDAKTINFMILYGGGPGKLAAALKIKVYEARKRITNYFETLPKVKKFIDGVVFVAQNRGYIINWFGRVSLFPDRDFGYKAPNSLIQGGTADVVKIALNQCDEFLAGTKSFPVLQVHDELVFELHRSELHLAPKLLEIMETAYQHKYLPLTCSAEFSWKSLADKTKGYPC